MAVSAHRTLAVVGAIVVIVVAYFIYDRLRSPCESIFEQASTRMNASLSVLRSGGEVAIGKAQIQELTERSQLVALNLKACCIALDGARLDSSQFLQCKSDAALYESRIARIGGLVGAAIAANAAGQTDVVAAKAQQAAREVEAAKQTASEFAVQVAQVAGGSAAPPSGVRPASAGVTPPPAARVQTRGAEAEPNNTVFEANAIAAGTSTAGELADQADVDWFHLRPGSAQRDWIKIKLDNRSQTLFPALTVHDADKKQIAEVNGANAGANAEVEMVVTPGADYFVKVNGRFSTAGAYALSTTLQKRFDRLEPNDDAFTAKAVDVGRVVDANVMDPNDVDWYLLRAFPKAAMGVRVENGSTTYVPTLKVYDRNRKLLADSDATNGGQSLELSLKVEAGQDHFVAIGQRWNTAGAYRLTVTAVN